ncbi:MAG: TolC family protein [Candidatus Aminicenantes bacterium]|nr:TolC family protein [Candidatus Aminicenantes bacterium]
MNETMMRLSRSAAVAAASLLLLAPSFSSEKTSFSLDELLAMGLVRNPRLASGALEVGAREAAYQASRRLSNPEFGLDLGRAEFHNREGGRATSGFSLSQPIESPFARRPRIEIERSAWEESGHAQANRIMETASEIKIRYFSLLLLQEKEHLLEKTAESARGMEAIVLKRAELGEVKPLDAVKLRVEVLKAEKETTALRAEMETARQDLNALLDNGLPRDFSVSGKLEAVSVPFDEDAVVERALAAHPLVRAGMARLEQSRSRVRFVLGRRFPDLVLRGFSESGLDGVNRGVALSLAVPLWNFKSKEAAEASLLAQAEEKELGAIRLDLDREIRAAVRRIRLAEDTLSVFDSALLREVEESLQIAEVSYREGELSLLDFLDSQRTYNSILGDYYQALYDWNAAMAALEKAAGGPVR